MRPSGSRRRFPSEHPSVPGGLHPASGGAFLSVCRISQTRESGKALPRRLTTPISFSSSTMLRASAG